MSGALFFVIPLYTPLRHARLMETAVWSIARWADTYLFPEEELPGILQQMYAAPGGQAVTVLDALVQVDAT